MGSERKFKRFNAGEEAIEVDRFNLPLEWLQRIANLEVSDDLFLEKDESGWFLAFAQQIVFRIQIPSGAGWTDGSPLAVQFYQQDHTLSGSGVTVSVMNRLGVTINPSGNKIGFVAWNGYEKEDQIIQMVC